MSPKTKKLLGKDSDGRTYASIDELWATELGTDFVKTSKKARVTRSTAAAAATAATPALSPATTPAPASNNGNNNNNDTSSSSVVSSSSAASDISDTKSFALTDKKKKKKKKKKKTSSAVADGNDDDNGDDDGEEKSRGTWYSKGADYWASVEATNNGVLGGFQEVSPVDVKQSRQFLDAVKAKRGGIAVDCGAGIGRVTRDLLLPYFGTVDLVEQDAKYVATARTNITDKRLQNCWCMGLQDFTPVVGRYDVIWIQWVIGHLPDDDMVAFLLRCIAGLAPGGFICIKENNTRAEDAFVLDKEDSSITRSNEHFHEIYRRAGLMCIKEQLQTKFPTTLLPVRMYALQPKPHMLAALVSSVAAIAIDAKDNNNNGDVIGDGSDEKKVSKSKKKKKKVSSSASVTAAATTAAAATADGDDA